MDNIIQGLFFLLWMISKHSEVMALLAVRGYYMWMQISTCSLDDYFRHRWTVEVCIVVWMVSAVEQDRHQDYEAVISSLQIS